MREIKFRAWDSRSNQMITDVLVWTRKDEWTSIILPHGMDNKRASVVIGDYWKTDNFGNQYTDLNVVIPMQYTGLKDSKGTDIYEGDIVRQQYGSEVLTYPIKWNEGMAGFAVGYDIGNKEIVGNIYENPELLGQPNA